VCGLFESPAKIRHIAHSHSFIVHLSRIWEEMLTRAWFHVQTQDMYQQVCDCLLYSFNFHIFSPYLPLICHFTHLHTVHKALSLWCQVTMPFREWLMYKNIKRLFRKNLSNPKNNTNDVTKSFRFCLPSTLSTIYGPSAQKQKSVCGLCLAPCIKNHCADTAWSVMSHTELNVRCFRYVLAGMALWLVQWTIR
jgi:hypothetical protein